MSTQTCFDALHRQEDPFGYRSRWYEARKRALLLASLPRQRYRSGWELGCSNGVLTGALAPRCDRLLATDISPRAVELARRAVRAHPHVQLQCARHPDQLPPGRFDLIVCSEMAYYLPPSAVAQLAEGLHATLDQDGLLVACHWRPAFDDRRCSTDAVHQAMGQGLHQVFGYRDADIVLEGWMRAPHSLAAEEGLR